MDICFYLDDYNVISSSVNEHLLNGKIRLFKNDKEIDCRVSTYDNLFYIYFDEEYKEKDILSVELNKKKYGVINRFIVHTKRFDEEYKCDVNTLGSFYTKESTKFRIWAPLNDGVNIVLNNKEIPMKYLGKGIYEICVKGDFDKAIYHFDIKRDGNTYSIKDPFSYSDTKDDKNSYVIDINSLNREKIFVDKTNDPIIYELSVRDFSSDESAPFKYKKKFLAFTEENLRINDKEIGLDYLAKLGVSHIQLMPVQNYDLDGGEYNWGYNPINYNTFNLDYVAGNDAYAPIKEFKAMVNSLHKKNLKVNLDVVYNHVYKIDECYMEKIIPYYMFRYYKDGSVGNASWCGNEVRSESYFTREYFNLINKRLVNIYDIDGLRFDLMGIIDIDSINYFYASLKEIKDDFLMYGEGWNMGDLLPDDKKANIDNAKKMPGIFFFNGMFRDAIKGPFNDKFTKGFIKGNRDFDLQIKDALLGFHNNGLRIDQSLDYIECHDNMTIFDKASLFNLSDDKLNTVCKFGLALVMFSRGIPFFNAGQEFMRTKNGIDNSYNLSDDINKIDWQRMIKHIDVVEYFRFLVDFRRNNPLFRIPVKAQFEYYYGIMVLDIDAYSIIINPTEYEYTYNSWITYSDVYYPDLSVKHDLKSFEVPSLSILVSRKS